MQDNFFTPNDDTEELELLLKRYEAMTSGKSNSFIDEEGFEKIVDYLQDKENTSKAMEVANTGLEYFPNSSSLLTRKADLLIIQHKYLDALHVLEFASLYDSGDINIYILKTDAYLALDQQPKAAEILNEALNMFEGDDKIDLLFELADVYDDYEQFDEVFNCLKMVLEQEPINEEALHKICFWTDFTGRNEESIRLHQKIIDEYPYNDLAWFNLGSAYQGLKLYEKAIDAYQYTVVIDEKFDYAFRNMGDALIRLRRFKEAIEVLEKIGEITRPEEVIYEAIGHCYHKLGKPAQARFNYRKASHINPEDSKLHYKIALTYMNETSWVNAIKQLEVALVLNRNSAEFNIAMGECCMELLRYKDAIHHFSIVVRNKPKNVTGWEYLIVALYKAGNYNEAISQCKNAFTATEQKPVFHYLLSITLFAAGKSKQALQQLETGLTKAPKLLKKFVAINPVIMQNSFVVDAIAKCKKSKKI